MNTRQDVKELTGLPLTEGELQSSHFELGFVVENVQETIEQFREQGIKIFSGANCKNRGDKQLPTSLIQMEIILKFAVH